MRLLELSKIQKLYFRHEDIARTLDISDESAKVSASRYVKQGLLVRLKRNLYVLREKWKILEKEEKFILANLMQVPSYISLMTALDYYEITTQMQRDFIESVAVKRTKEKEVEYITFRYTKVSEDLYFDFRREKGFFIATPEKALLDTIYLSSLGRYSIDHASIDIGKLDREHIERLAAKFPQKTSTLLAKYEYF
ncbi:MAG: hypothetical protein OEM19_06345 [Deltaproteobacteria bacterium]|nr:hypothetical protein [Deltaproteobacteria bacterium]